MKFGVVKNSAVVKIMTSWLQLVYNPYKRLKPILVDCPIGLK